MSKMQCIIGSDFSNLLERRCFGIFFFFKIRFMFFAYRVDFFYAGVTESPKEEIYIYIYIY
jgi:hypothetical protein